MAPKRKPIAQRLASYLDLLQRNPHRLALAYAMRARRAGWLPLRRGHIGPVRFPFEREISPYVGTMMTGEYEFETLAVMRHFLRSGRIFLDVGANMGYLSAWGLRLVGRRGAVHAVEPAGIMARRIEELARLNPRYTLVLHRVGAGDIEGEADLTLAGDGMMGNTTLVADLIPAAEAMGSERVRVVRLDAYLERTVAERIGLIKIDVEGFESQVLRGMAQWFREGLNPPIICELYPHASRLSGRDPLDTLAYMAQWGYDACSVRDFRPLPPERVLKLGKVFNVLFVHHHGSV